MGDLRTVAVGLEADFAVDGLGLEQDGGLGTAVYLSLFTWRLADASDVLPDGGSDRRGWWADSVAPLRPGHLLGSRLWLLFREKQLPEVLRRAEIYALDALAWLLDVGAVSAVAVVASNPRHGLLGLDITLTGPTGAAATYSLFWDWMLHAV